jgi:N-acetylneuraminate synthase/N,N'-diacetyllegionaminate synthase
MTEISDIQIEIAGRKIGDSHPVFIIAEVGVNHNSDIELAKQLVRKAKECGADCVKFQTFKAERVVIENAPKAKYQLKTTDPGESQIEMLKKLEMPEEAYNEIIQCCQENEIIFLSTPYNIEDVEFLNDLGFPAFKLASISVAEPWFAAYTAKKGKPIILSTGMATIGEVDETVHAIRETGNDQLIILQCTTNYPSRHEDANLLAMQTMQKAFGLQIGYSDHTQDDTACIMSVALGAKVIEKHFTLDRTLPGPDQSSSYEPKKFSELVRKIRNAEAVLGSERKEPCEIEKENAVGMRRSIVTKANISKGVVISTEMLTFKRPAAGLAPKFLHEIVGCKARRNIPINSLIQWSDIGE